MTTAVMERKNTPVSDKYGAAGVPLCENSAHTANSWRYISDEHFVDKFISSYARSFDKSTWRSFEDVQKRAWSQIAERFDYER